MVTQEKVTAHDFSVTADNGQPQTVNCNISIADTAEKINYDFEMDFLREYFQKTNEPDYLHTVSLTELYDTVYQPKAQIINNFLCSGVYLFVGAPKVGKSFFMAQLGYHVSGGVPLWDYPTHRGTVLYLALEDDYARLQKIREAGGEKSSYASDHEIVARLKQFADQYNVCVLLVHHTRKQTADDCSDTISGTNGLLGAADGAFIMQKEKRTDNKATLDIVGRDQQDQWLHLLFDRERCLWQLTKAETQLWEEPPDPLLETVSKMVSPDFPEWGGSASELLYRLDGIDVQPNVLARRLNVSADRLWNEYGVRIESNRSHAGRTIRLMLIEQRDDSDGRDDIFSSGCGV